MTPRSEGVFLCVLEDGWDVDACHMARGEVVGGEIDGDCPGATTDVEYAHVTK